MSCRGGEFSNFAAALRRGSLYALVLSVCLAAASPTPGFTSEPPKRVLFVNPGFADKGFWKAVSETMEAAATALGFELTIVSGDRKWPLMVSRGLAALNDLKPDYAILVNEHQQVPQLMEAAEADGIKTILLLNGLTADQEARMNGPRQTLSNWLGTITPDNEIAGYEMAQSLLTAGGALGLDKDGLSILTLAGDFKTPASIVRLQGLDRALQEFRPLSEARRITVNWSERQAYERTKIFLKTSRVDGIWAANDPIAIGAIKASREAGKEPGRDIVVTGLNWSREAVDLVRDGKMTLTHGGHFLAGAWVIVLLYDYENGKDFAEISSHLSFPMSSIHAGNADAYVDAFGDGDWSKINFKHFSRAENPSLKKYPFNLTALLSSRRVD
ncbi:sugar ABC transporter substrate-binding protein [Hwanghaeella grinnelliae]|uniref:Sugar ABC transporter substrate-binding protein n=1 Tax=Hwanghaeella grinnelliae TaxID=2500179 RepID=A0A3S2VKW2_9PROT|nr:ABC transporter substrate-binding protein [Hwanghaeella grinnelliae]RVU34587.1 sugar ABC transporter substrate-binding protein [Hwanghaeella grinnelliae]